MRIHTNRPDEVRQAIRTAASILPGVSAELSSHGSRSHAGALEVSLEGNGRTGGQWGGTDHCSATWDEWGVIFAAIFTADHDALAGNVKCPIYADGDHFAWATGARFSPDELPEDTHPRHRWEYSGESVSGSYSVNACKRCTAVRRFVAYGRTWAELGA
jgi:hypothetical protein